MVYETVLPTLLISTEQNGCFVISQRGIVKSPLNQPVKPYVSTSTAIICVAIGSNSPNIIISRKFTIAMKNGPFIDGLPKVTYKNMVIFFAVTVFPSFLWTTCLGSFSNPAETIETLKNRKKKSIGIPWVNGFFDRVSLEFPWTPYRNPIKKTIDPLRIPKKKKKLWKLMKKNCGPSSSAFLHSVTVPSAAPLASAASPPATLRTSLWLSSWPVQRSCRATMGELTCASFYLYDICNKTGYIYIDNVGIGILFQLMGL